MSDLSTCSKCGAKIVRVIEMPHGDNERITYACGAVHDDIGGQHVECPVRLIDLAFTE